MVSQTQNSLFSLLQNISQNKEMKPRNGLSTVITQPVKWMGVTEGTVTCKWPNGDSYCGEWLQGRLNGRGTLKLGNISYEGNFSNGFADGTGKVTIVVDNIKTLIEGSFKFGLLNGSIREATSNCMKIGTATNGFYDGCFNIIKKMPDESKMAFKRLYSGGTKIGNSDVRIIEYSKELFFSKKPLGEDLIQKCNQEDPATHKIFFVGRLNQSKMPICGDVYTESKMLGHYHPETQQDTAKGIMIPIPLNDILRHATNLAPGQPGGSGVIRVVMRIGSSDIGTEEGEEEIQVTTRTTTTVEESTREETYEPPIKRARTSEPAGNSSTEKQEKKS